MFSTKHCFEKGKIGHHSRLRDVISQFYPIYACTCANHVRYRSMLHFAVPRNRVY